MATTTETKQPFCRDLRKNAAETLRIEQSAFKGHRLAAIRVWVPSDPTDPTSLKPTQKGVTVRVEMVPEIIAALQALQAAETGQ